MSSKFREGFKKIFRKVTCKNNNNRTSSGDHFETSSALRLHSRRSVTKESSFEVLSNTVNNTEDDISVRVDESNRQSFSKRGDRKNFGNQNDKEQESTPTEENVKAESILLIEEKQYRLIKAKGHFNI